MLSILTIIGYLSLYNAIQLNDSSNKTLLITDSIHILTNSRVHKFHCVDYAILIVILK